VIPRLLLIVALTAGCTITGSTDEHYCYDAAGMARATQEGRGVGPFRNNANPGTHVCTPAELDAAKIPNEMRPASQRSK